MERIIYLWNPRKVSNYIMKISHLAKQTVYYKKLYGVKSNVYSNYGSVIGLKPVLVTLPSYKFIPVVVSDIKNSVDISRNKFYFTPGQGAYDSILNKYEEFVYPVSVDTEVVFPSAINATTYDYSLETDNIVALGEVYTYNRIKDLYYKLNSEVCPKVKILCYKDNILDSLNVVSSISSDVLRERFHESILSLVFDNRTAKILTLIRSISEKACAYCIHNEHKLFFKNSFFMKVMNKKVLDLSTYWGWVDSANKHRIDNYKELENVLNFLTYEIKLPKYMEKSSSFVDYVKYLESKYIPIESPYDNE